MRKFTENIEELELCDTHLVGCSFTWRGDLIIRLDKFFFDNKWGELGGVIVQTILPRPISDHCRVLLETGIMPRTQHLSVREYVAKGFGVQRNNGSLVVSYSIHGPNSYLLVENLNMLLKIWNCEVFGEIQWKKDEAQYKLK